MISLSDQVFQLPAVRLQAPLTPWIQIQQVHILRGLTVAARMPPALALAMVL